MKFLEDYDAVVAFIEPKAETTRKNYLNAVIVALQALKGDKALIAKYEQLRDKYNKAYTELIHSHQKTASQEANWVEWPDYLKLVEDMGEAVRPVLNARGRDWIGEEREAVQDYLLVLLYSKLPVRNDFADMKVIYKKECNQKTKDGDQQNYLVMAQPTPFFCLNAYKTARKKKGVGWAMTK